MSKKSFIVGAIIVFIAGLIGGAYLVLKSSVTQGELANSTPAQNGKSSDELLAELLKINQQEQNALEPYIPPEDKNLTEDFLKTIVDKSAGDRINPKQIASDDFFVSTILPYLKGNQIDLFPEIPDSVLKITTDSKANLKKYYQDTNKDMIVFFDAVKKITKTDETKLQDPATQDELNTLASNLASSFQNLSRTEVPPSQKELHKKIMVSVLSLQKMTEAMINYETDPLKSLLVINEAEALGKFWQETLYDYVKYPQSKRSQ